jgi:hypothetical protein
MADTTQDAILEAIGFVRTEPTTPKPEKPNPTPAEKPSLAHAIYGHLRVNSAKAPLVYSGNLVTIRGPNGKAYSQ